MCISIRTLAWQAEWFLTSTIQDRAESCTEMSVAMHLGVTMSSKEITTVRAGFIQRLAAERGIARRHVGSMALDRGRVTHDAFPQQPPRK